MTTYDSFRRVTQVRKYLAGYQTDDACQRVNYYYDTNPFESNFTENGWGRLAAVEYGDPSCTGGQFRELYSYTASGLPVKKKLMGGFGSGSLLGQWSYNNEGQVVTVKHPDTRDNSYNLIVGRTYTTSYDAMGRPLKVTDNQALPVDWAKDATYGVAGELTQLRLWLVASTYKTETRTYNTRLQTTGISWDGGYGTDLLYSYNATANDGRLAQMQHVKRNPYTPPTTTTIGYDYDALGRLITAGTASYTYDGFGNRIGQTSPQMNLTYYTENNRISTTGYSYDSNGNLTATPELSMSYNVENRLAQATNTTTNQTEYYSYAPNGQRVRKSTVLNSVQGPLYYFWGVDGKLIGEYSVALATIENPGGAPGYEYVFQQNWTCVYLGGRMVAKGGATVAQDRLGTVDPDESSTPLYKPYGERTPAPSEDFGFTGYYRDWVTGLDYAQQRYYSPSIGRFTTADPYMPSAAIGRPQSLNRYAHVENDPVNFVDPTGLIAWKPAPAGPGDGIGTFGLMMAGAWQAAMQLEQGNLLFAQPVGGKGTTSWRPFDTTATGFARGLLAERLTGFRDSNCGKLFKEAGVDLGKLESVARRLRAYDARAGAEFAGVTVDSVVGNSDKSTLEAVWKPSGTVAQVVSGSYGSVILLFADFYGPPNLDSTLTPEQLYGFWMDKENTLLHEAVHIVGLKDSDVFSNVVFLHNGLNATDYRARGNIDAFTTWLSKDCK